MYWRVHADETIYFGKTVIEAIPFGPLPFRGLNKTTWLLMDSIRHACNELVNTMCLSVDSI